MVVDYVKLFDGFGSDKALNLRLAKLLDEANHVHFCHPDIWKREGQFKDHAASKLAIMIQGDRRLIRRFLGLRDRTLSMLVYRAVDLLKAEADLETLSKRSSV